jgi:hypothetical protein
MAANPYRIRLPRGKNIHAVGSRPGFPDGVTACGTVVPENADRLDDDEPATCPKCLRNLT